MSLFEIRGTIPLHPLDHTQSDSLITAIEQRLSADAWVSREDSCTVRFSRDFGQLFDSSAYSAIGSANSGEIRFVASPEPALEYRLSTVRLTGIMLALAFALSAITAFDRPALFALASLLVFALGILAARAIDNYRVRRLLTELASPALRVRAAEPRECPYCGRLYDPSDYREDAVAMCEYCHSPLN